MVDPLRNECKQTARKASAHAGCDQIARSPCRTPRHRSQNYDLRRAPCDHRDLVRNAAHGGLNQRFPSPTRYCSLLRSRDAFGLRVTTFEKWPRMSFR